MTYFFAGVVGVFLGIVSVLIWQFAHDKGHSVFGVKDKQIQSSITSVIMEFTNLKPTFMIESGPTHQQVFSDGTVFSWFDDDDAISGLPKNVRSLVVNDKVLRLKAASKLFEELRGLGYKTTMHQPLKEFPNNTFILIESEAFEDCGIAFRPHRLRMMFLAKRAMSKRMKELDEKPEVHL